MYTMILISLLTILSNADDGCCECTDSLNGPQCNDACDANICPNDSYCCEVHWDWICADAACAECDDCHHEEYGYDYGSYSDWGYDYGYDYYGDYGYEDSWYSDYDQYGYDYDCDCNYICGGESPEEWEQSIYEEVPPCIVDNCGEQFQTCAFNDECVTGIDNVVNLCYESDEDPIQCMDGLIADEANTGFISACGGNEECGTDLKSLGTCVANAANYGFCSEEVMKKLQLKSVVKSIKIKSRKLKRKSAALKSKSKRSRERRLRQRPRKLRGRRPSKLRSRTSRRKLQSYGYESEYDNDYGSDYENPDYDYGCYCDCGEEDDEIPPCIIDNCSEQLFSCTDSEDCVAGIIGVEATCYEDNDNPEECMNELIQESNGQQAIELCNGNEEAAGNLQELGQCVANTFNSGDCGEPYKKLKIKALVRTTKKVRARKVASKQRRSRSLRRARAVRAQKLRRAKLGKRQKMKMRPRLRARPRPRPQMRRQRLGKVQRARAERGKTMRSQMQRQRSMKLRGRKQKQEKLRQRRKLQSAGGDEACCDCTESENGAGCSANPECDAIVCPLDSWCCKYSWDGICANGANNICNAADYWSWPTYYNDYSDYNYYDYGEGSDYGFESFYDDSYYPQDSETDGSCCDCKSASGGPGCNAVCDNEVCELDPYCCNNQWDSICANGASNICQGYDYFGSSDDSWNDYNNWDSFGYNYDYSFYSPPGDFTYSDEPYYNSDEWSYSYYEPYNFDDSYNDWYDYGFSTYEPNYVSFGYDYSFYSPSGDFTWSDEPYWNSYSYSYYPPLKQRKARLSKRAGARSRRAMDMAQKRRQRQRGRKLRNRARRQSKRSLQEDSNIN